MASNFLVSADRESSFWTMDCCSFNGGKQITKDLMNGSLTPCTVAPVPSSTILFEIDGVAKNIAVSAFKTGGAKLPVKTAILL